MQELRAAIQEMRPQRNEQADKIVQLTAQCSAANLSNIQWKKEGNKKQHEFLMNVVLQNRQARENYAAGNKALGAAYQAKLSEIQVQSTGIEIIGITESWCNNLIPDCSLQLPDYNLLRLDRSDIIIIII